MRTYTPVPQPPCTVCGKDIPDRPGPGRNHRYHAECRPYERKKFSGTCHRCGETITPEQRHDGGRRNFHKGCWLLRGLENRRERMAEKARKRAEREAEGFACRICKSTEHMYNHGSPNSGVCRVCSHKACSEKAKAQYEGLTFGSLLVLSLDREVKQKRGGWERYWKIRCSVCNRESVKNQSKLRTTMCVHCAVRGGVAPRDALSPLRPLVGVRRETPSGIRIRQAYAKLRNIGHNKRGIPVTINETDVGVLIFAPCSYCGEPPSEKGHGIDRLDNSKGYKPGNVTSCCWNCNRAKGSLTLVEFGVWVERISAHMAKGCVERDAPPAPEGCRWLGGKWVRKEKHLNLKPPPLPKPRKPPPHAPPPGHRWDGQKWVEEKP